MYFIKQRERLSDICQLGLDKTGF